MVEYEKELCKLLKDKGWEVIRNGWPDILATDPQGDSYFIEIKSKSDKLRPGQIKMLSKLSDLGLNACLVNESPTQHSSAVKRNDFFWDIDKDRIKKALIQNGGNLRSSAIQLGITTRSIRYRIAKYGIKRLDE